MERRAAIAIGLVIAALGGAAPPAGAAEVKALTKDLFAVPSTTGNEEQLAGKIKSLLPKGLAVEEDGLGTIAVRFAGTPGPLLLIAALDGYGHMVGGFTPDGYLTLDRPVAAPHARFDAFLMGQPIIVTTAQGPVPGIVAQPALHLLTPERRRALVDGFSLETAFVDIGVRSEKEARARGVERLDPVTYPAVLTELAGGQWAGPALGTKSAAAALAAALEGLTARTAGPETIVAWAAQTKFGARGRGARPAVGAARARNRWLPARTVVVDLIAAGKGDGFPFPGGGPVLVQYKSGASGLRRAFEAAAAAAGTPLQFMTAPDTPLSLPFEVPPGEVVTLGLPVRFLDSPSEVVHLGDLEALAGILTRFLQTGGAQ